ncbi:MAG: hypothetical protein HQK85_12325 [Nitrospinae bacterium]|nr:hypothetical protein [Nitrospinota bacterium]
MNIYDMRATMLCACVLIVAIVTILSCNDSKYHFDWFGRREFIPIDKNNTEHYDNNNKESNNEIISVPTEVIDEIYDKCKLNVIGGVYVYKLGAKTNMAKAGVMEKDIILKYNYMRIYNLSQFCKMTSAYKPKTLYIEIMRKCEVKQLYVEY